MNYGKAMKYIRTAENDTQLDIANKLGMSENTYTQYELQNKIIPLIYLNEFCNIYNISIDYILGFVKQRQYKNTKKHINSKLAAERLITFRKKHNLSQSSLSKKVNDISKSTISDYENEKYLFSTAFIYSLCKKYNISADYILGRTDFPINIG